MESRKKERYIKRKMQRTEKERQIKRDIKKERYRYCGLTKLGLREVL